MTVNEASLFVLAAAILMVGLHIDTPRETKPKHKRRASGR